MSLASSISRKSTRGLDCGCALALQVGDDILVERADQPAQVADALVGLRKTALDLIDRGAGALRRGLQRGERAGVQAGELGPQRGQAGLDLRQPRQLGQAALQVDEVPHPVAGQAQPLLQARNLPGQAGQLIPDGGEPRLALRDLPGDGAAADEPATVMPRVEVAAAELAAHEALAGDSLAVVAQRFQCLALDVTAKQQVHVGAGDRMVGLHLRGQAVGPAPPDFARTGGARVDGGQDAVAVGQADAVQVVLEAAGAIDAHGGIVVAGRHEEVEARHAQNALDGVLPRLVGHVERLAEVDHFVGAQAQLGAQQAAQPGGRRGLGFVGGVAVAGAELRDLPLEAFPFLAQPAHLLREERAAVGVGLGEGGRGRAWMADCLPQEASCRRVLSPRWRWEARRGRR